MVLTERSLSIIQSLKLAFIVLCLGVAAAITIYDGRISAFAPRHAMVVFDTVAAGSIPEYRLTDFTRGFYAFGAVLVLVTGFSEAQLLFVPVLLAPTVVVLFVLIYRLAGKTGSAALLAALLASGYNLYGSNGTDKLFLGLHGVGWVMLFAVILVLLFVVGSERRRQNSHLALLLCLTTAAVFVSYNRSAEIMLLFGWVVLIAVGLSISDRASNLSLDPVRRLPFQLISLIAITWAAHAFFNTFLDRFVPWLVGVTVGSDHSVLERILARRFGAETDVPLSDLYINTPQSLSLIGVGRYLLMGVMILVFLALVTRRMRDRRVTAAGVVITAFVFGEGVFFLIRAVVGNLNVTIAYLPAIFATAALHAYASDVEIGAPRIGKGLWTLSVGVAAILVVTSLIYMGIAYDTDMLNDHEESFVATEAAAAWHADYAGENLRSDEFTSSAIRLHTYDHPSFEPMENIKQASPHEIRTSLGRETMDEERYFIFNYQLNYLVFSGWNRLMGWDEIETVRQNNPRIDRVYDQGSLSTYRHPSTSDASENESETD